MKPLADDRNITLIGMPGVGKSTIGVLLAKETRRQFVDTDVLIQARHGRTLQDILDADGLDAFRQIEEQAVQELDLHAHVIATGGSVVYYDAAMEHLSASGPVVYLELALELLERRIENLSTRGVVRPPGVSLADLYAERLPLYRRWADVTVDCWGKTQDGVVAEILTKLGWRVESA